MNEEIKDVVIKMFVYNDEHNWEGLESVFAPNVRVLHLLEGNEREEQMTPKQIVNAWRPIMERTESVHHQIGNILIRSKNQTTATVTCHGISTHYKSNRDKDFWEVVGTYEFELIKIENEWKISKEIFRCKYYSDM